MTGENIREHEPVGEHIGEHGGEHGGIHDW
jgi:hypothetical protein